MVAEREFAGKTVLVVGGSSGIGNAIAQAFRHAGAHVHVWGTRPGREDYDPAEGSDLTGLGYDRIDVSSYEEIEAAPTPFDHIDVLVLSQGAVVYKRAEYQPDIWRKVVGINLDSVMDCCRRFYPALSRDGGSVIIISSLAGLSANRGNPAYAASKAAAINLTRSLGQAWAGEGIRVNGIAPGLIDTKLTQVTTGDKQRLETMLKAIPAGRIGDPAEIAGAALFLASRSASYIIGQTIAIDGGYSL